MSKTDYKQVAKKLGVRYLFGRWGVSFYSYFPDGDKIWRPRLIPLDGWSFDKQDIIESFANDPDFSISYKEKK